MGRFLNADAFTSTGQGLLGNNMFAYCLNNPVGFADPSGYAAGWTNLVNICDGGTSRFIYNQNDEPYGSMILGSASVAHGGCGPVAVNNAAQLLGNNSTSLGEIIDFYRNTEGLDVGGWLGTSLNAAADFFEVRGYDTVVLSVDEIYNYSGIESGFDAGIILYWYESSKFPYFGSHYVAFRQYDTVGYYYNTFSDSTDVYKHTGSLVDFLEYRGYYPIELLLISRGS